MSSISTSSRSKSRPPSILTSNGPSPLLISPISVVQRSNNNGRPHSAGRNNVGGLPKEQQNWMRQQWIANLKKKRQQQQHRTDGNLKKNSLKEQKSFDIFNGGPENDVMSSGQILTTEVIDKLNFHEEYNGIAIGEIEDPLEEDNVGVHAGVGTRKKWVKNVLKKRTSGNVANCDPLSQRPHTPRRKLNCGSAFEDTESCHSNVGTPTNFNSDTNGEMWNFSTQDIDLACANNDNEADRSTSDIGFDSTYLDGLLPSPRHIPANTPTYPTNFQKFSHNIPNVVVPQTPSNIRRPKLVRTRSLEQEKLSQYLEQTRLSSNSPAGSTILSEQQQNSEIYSPHSSTEIEALLDDTKFEKELDNFYMENIGCFSGSQF